MTQPNTEVLSKVYFEDILPETGWGLYYKFMWGMACVCSFTQAMAFLAVPFCIPLATCEGALITRKILLGIQMSFLLGRAVFGLLFNALADIYGRKRFLTYSLIIIFITTFSAAFAYNYYVIVLAAFFLASGLESNLCVVRVHLAEILPRHRRGLFLATCDVCWTLGYLFMSAFTIFMKNPQYMERRTVDMRLTSWRMLFAISGGLNITLACATALLEESPRYFMHVKKNYLSLLTLRQFFAINKSSYGESFQVKEEDLKKIIHDYDLSIYPEPRGGLNSLKKIARILSKAVKLMFSGPFIRSSIALLIIKTTLLILGPLDVNILLAKQADVNSKVQEGIDVIYLDSLKNHTMCNDWEESMYLYYVYFGLGTCILAGNVIVMLTVDCLGRKFLGCAGLVLCGGCFITLFYVKDSMTRIILSSGLMFSLGAAITTITIINIEVFPTALRCTSWGVLNFFGIIAYIFVTRFYHYMSEYFPIILGVAYCAAAVSVCFIDDLKKKPMIE